MAENDAPQGAPEAPETPTPEAPEKETDWKSESRKWEQRAKENLAAAKANEDAAKRLADIEESQKTEAQKTQERLDAAEKRASELEMKATRAEVAAEKGVPIALLSGVTKEEIEASADALLAFRGEPANGPVVPKQGAQPDSTKTGTPAQIFGDLLTQQLKH